jgi:hypothetical protein
MSLSASKKFKLRYRRGQWVAITPSGMACPKGPTLALAFSSTHNQAINYFAQAVS